MKTLPLLMAGTLALSSNHALAQDVCPGPNYSPEQLSQDATSLGVTVDYLMDDEIKGLKKIYFTNLLAQTLLVRKSADLLKSGIQLYRSRPSSSDVSITCQDFQEVDTMTIQSMVNTSDSSKSVADLIESNSYPKLNIDQIRTGWEACHDHALDVYFQARAGYVTVCGESQVVSDLLK